VKDRPPKADNRGVLFNLKAPDKSLPACIESGQHGWARQGDLRHERAARLARNETRPRRKCRRPRRLRMTKSPAKGNIVEVRCSGDALLHFGRTAIVNENRGAAARQGGDWLQSEGGEIECGKCLLSRATVWGKKIVEQKGTECSLLRIFRGIGSVLG